MGDLFDDLRYTLRTLRQSPGFALSAIAAIALGIGSTTAIFSVVNKVLLEPLPYPDPDRLVQLMSTSELGNQSVVSIPKYLAWRALTSAFGQIAAYEIGGPGVNLVQGGEVTPVRAAHVSADYFSLFGVDVKSGRTFTNAEDRPGSPRVAVISDELWRGRFHSDPSLVGKTIPFDRELYKLIGVLAPGFSTELSADAWFPLQADASADHVSRVRVAARLRPGMTIHEGSVDLDGTMNYFLRRYPAAPILPLEHFTAISLRDAVVGDIRPALFLLTGAVGFVLLISCANVANLLLARGTRRVREMAIRAALGARRERIVRQLLSESVLLSIAGGVVGLALGYLGVRELLAVSPVDVPRIGANGSAIGLDWRIFAFTLVVSLATRVLFGLLPAVAASRTDVSSLVKDTQAQSGMGFRRNRGRAALVVAEMAMALVLVAGAALLVRTLVASRVVNRGFDEQNVMTIEMSLANGQFKKTADVAQLVRSAVRRLRRITGVAAVAATNALPLEPAVILPFTIFKNDQLRGRYDGAAPWRSVSPGYFDAFHIRLLRGRLFTEDDDEHAAPVVLINRMMFKKYWQSVDADPIGEFITIGKGMGLGLEDMPLQIVGVIADVRESGLNREPMMYVPVAQVPDGMNARNIKQLPIAWVVRMSGSEPLALESIRQELKQISGGLPLQRVRSMREIVAASSARTQFYTMLLSVFAGIALVLAAFGLYGLMAYSVQERVHEIGIRMALGAAPADVRQMVVWQGMRLALLGILIGVPLALGLTRVMDSMIFGIQKWDPAVFVAEILLLGGVGCVAMYGPSLRATRINPADALRG
jgi:putative ABC transport system permease protein